MIRNIGQQDDAGTAAPVVTDVPAVLLGNRPGILGLFGSKGAIVRGFRSAVWGLRTGEITEIIRGRPKILFTHRQGSMSGPVTHWQDD